MAATWRVLSQRQQEELTPAGTFRSIIVVTFEVLSSGTTGSVIVPLNQYDASFVESAITERVDKIMAVENL